MIRHKQMTAREFCTTLELLAMDKVEAATLLGCDLRTTQRYAMGATRVPGPAAIILRALTRREITLYQVQALASAKPPH